MEKVTHKLGSWQFRRQKKTGKGSAEVPCDPFLLQQNPALQHLTAVEKAMGKKPRRNSTNRV